MKLTSSRICRPLAENVALCEILTTRVADPLLIRQVEQELLKFAEKETFKYMLLDCGRVKEYSSMFFSMLLRLKKALEPKATLRVCSMSKEMSKGFKACKLDSIIPCYETVQDGLAGR